MAIISSDRIIFTTIYTTRVLGVIAVSVINRDIHTDDPIISLKD